MLTKDYKKQSRIRTQEHPTPKREPKKFFSSLLQLVKSVTKCKVGEEKGKISIKLSQSIS